MPLTAEPALVAALRADLCAVEYTVEHLARLLGPVASAALAREQVLPTEQVTRDNPDPAAVLVRLFTLGDPVDAALVDRALPTLTAGGAVALGIARFEGDALVANCDLRPYGDERHTWWVASDHSELATRAPLAPDHVLGIGAASTTLATWTPRPHAARALDLGTGCGVQALHLSGHCDHVIVTDVSERALGYARFNAALNEQTWEVRRGSMLEPVAGQEFDLIVSNPPFVITPRDPDMPTYEYRDGGGHGDSVVEHLVTHLGAHLAPGGIAQLLGNWEIVGDGAWTDRLGQWARRSGVDVWVVQRDVQDPAQYAETWARDGGHQAASAEFAVMYAAWLADFAARGVTSIGFGVITLHRPQTDREPFVDLLDAQGAIAEPMGAGIRAGIAARVWLAEHTDSEILDDAWTVAPDVTIEHHFVPGEADPRAILARKAGGIAGVDRLDTEAAAFLSVADGELTARAALTAIAAVLDRPAADVISGVLPRLKAWIAAGVVHNTVA